MLRRHFLKHGLLASGALALGRMPSQGAPKAAFDEPVRKFAHDVVELGPDKIKLSRLAMGTGSSLGTAAS